MDRMELKLGEEQAVHLPPGAWSVEVEGMTSAVSVRRLWPADPYPDDDEEEQGARPAPDVVFMIRGEAPGTANLRFSREGRDSGDPTRDVRVEVRL